MEGLNGTNLLYIKKEYNLFLYIKSGKSDTKREKRLAKLHEVGHLKNSITLYAMI